MGNIYIYIYRAKSQHNKNLSCQFVFNQETFGQYCLYKPCLNCPQSFFFFFEKNKWWLIKGHNGLFSMIFLPNTVYKTENSLQHYGRHGKTILRYMSSI
jgi:hypothetical protein